MNQPDWDRVKWSFAWVADHCSKSRKARAHGSTLSRNERFRAGSPISAAMPITRSFARPMASRDSADALAAAQCLGAQGVEIDVAFEAARRALFQGKCNCLQRFGGFALKQLRRRHDTRGEPTQPRGHTGASRRGFLDRARVVPLPQARFCDDHRQHLANRPVRRGIERRHRSQSFLGLSKPEIGFRQEQA